jgi:hypothetical protein
MTVRFRRVEQALALIGGLFDTTDTTDADIWRAVQHAIDNQVPEDDDLDFKREWWSDNKELAKDCVAFANASGGVLIYGVDDQGIDVAAGWSPVASKTNFDEQVQSVTASRVAPKLSRVLVRWVPNPDGSDTGVGIIGIPRTSNAPHAAVDRNRLTYPIRRSKITDYMSESEVADRYRNRFEMARTDQDRAQTITNVARPALLRANNIWLTVTFVPSLPGNLPMSSDQASDTAGLVWQWQAEMPLEHNQTRSFTERVRRKRIVISSDAASRVSQYQHHELWLDGSGFASAVVGKVQGGETLRWCTAVQPDLEFVLFWLTDLLTQHAVRAGAAGDGIFVAQLLPAWDDDSLNATVTTPDITRTGQAPGNAIPFLINAESAPDEARMAHARHVDGEPAQVTAPLDAIAESPGELIIATRRLAVDLLAEDGVSDVPSLTAAGEFDPRGLLNELARLARAWASTRGIALVG